MAIIALVISPSEQPDQTPLIERLVTAKNLEIDRWLTCKSVEQGHVDWITDDTVIVATANLLLIQQSASNCMKMIETWLEQGITLWFANTEESLNESMINDPSTLIRVVADSLQISEQTIRRQIKAKAAASKRRKAGLHNGRKHGAVVRCKLDAYRKTINMRLGQGVSKTALAKQLGVSRSTLYVWLARNN